MRFKRTIFSILMLFVFQNNLHLYSSNKDFLNISSDKLDIERDVSVAVDSFSKWDINNISQKNFEAISKDFGNVLNFGVSDYSYWCKINVINNDDEQYLKLSEPLIDRIELYLVSNNEVIKYAKTGSLSKFDTRELKVSEFMFLLPKGKYTCYFKIKSNFNLQIPISIVRLKEHTEIQHGNDFILALYFGLMLIMIIYNFFVYLSTRDISYVYYILYIFFVTFFYSSLKGVAFEYFWPNSPNLNYFVPTYASIINIFGALFIINLLQINKYLPKLSFGMYFVIVASFFCIVLNVFGYYQFSAKVSQLFTAVFSLYAIFVGIQALRIGVKVAKYFLLAWTFFLLSVVIYILKLNGILAYSSFTNNSVLFGSALEALLLSFALADKINTYKKEKEEQQVQKLAALEENKNIILNQNVLLEQKVTEKTKELVEANGDLQEAMIVLQNTQVSLVEAEKMASLGQLTAGVAHEINNPINFVSSNVKPLIRDFEDVKGFIDKLMGEAEEKGSIAFADIAVMYEQMDLEYTQKEIKELLEGIKEGAIRTTEIVKGLKNFSRLDEAAFKTANIEEGLDSTLILLRSTLKGEVELVKNYGLIPEIDCYAGKLNQVFMNLINNSVYAILNDPKHEIEKTGKVILTTINVENAIEVIIEDNGTGMSEDSLNKLFNPFYTTKPPGEGTGLGMSITYSIINELHKGKIKVDSTVGEGTAISIVIPKHLKK